MKLKSLIEVKKIDDKEIEKIDDLIKKVDDYNKKSEHTKALIELAKFLNDTKMEKILSKVDDIVDIVGKIPQEVRMYEAELRIKLRKEFEKKYGREQYNRLEDVI